MFDGESYLKYKEKQAAEKLAEQLSGAVKGAISGTAGEKDAADDGQKEKLAPISEIDNGFREKVKETFIKPRSAREEIEELKGEQAERRKVEPDVPKAVKRADESDNKGFKPKIEPPKLEPRESGSEFSFMSDEYNMYFLEDKSVHIDLQSLSQKTMTKIIADDEYRNNFAKAINKYYIEQIDEDGLGISDESLSVEIWWHAALYRASTLFSPLTDTNNLLSGMPLLTMLNDKVIKPRTETIDAGGENEIDRGLWDWLSD